MKAGRRHIKFGLVVHMQAVAGNGVVQIRDQLKFPQVVLILPWLIMGYGQPAFVCLFEREVQTPANLVGIDGVLG